MMISDYEDLRLDIRKSDGEKGAVVGYSSRNSKLNKDSQYEAELYSENYLGAILKWRQVFFEDFGPPSPLSDFYSIRFGKFY